MQYLLLLSHLIQDTTDKKFQVNDVYFTNFIFSNNCFSLDCTVKDFRSLLAEQIRVKFPGMLPVEDSSIRKVNLLILNDSSFVEVPSVFVLKGKAWRKKRCLGTMDPWKLCDDPLEYTKTRERPECSLNLFENWATLGQVN